MIWFLTFGKNGSAGMPAVPATILMSADEPKIPLDSVTNWALLDFNK